MLPSMLPAWGPSSEVIVAKQQQLNAGGETVNDDRVDDEEDIVYDEDDLDLGLVEHLDALAVGSDNSDTE
jgi:hypothetical protein